MKYFSFLLVIIVNSQVSCQGEGVHPTIKDVFLDAIQSEVFEQEFKICELECSYVDVFDLGNLIDDSPIESEICSKKINIYNTSSIDHPTPSSIVIYRLDKDDNGSIVIYFLRPYSGAALILEYSIEDDLKLLNTKIGTF